MTNGDGDAKYTPCVEGTWKWRGKSWADSAEGEAVGCANPDGGNSGLWCATEVDSDGIYQNWGYCDMDMGTCKKNGMIHFHFAIGSWPRKLEVLRSPYLPGSQNTTSGGNHNTTPSAASATVNTTTTPTTSVQKGRMFLHNDDSICAFGAAWIWGVPYLFARGALLLLLYSTAQPQW